MYPQYRAEDAFPGLSAFSNAYCSSIHITSVSSTQQQNVAEEEVHTLTVRDYLNGIILVWS